MRPTKIVRWIFVVLLLIPAIVYGQNLPTVPIYTYSVPSPAPSATAGYAPNGNLMSYTDSVNGSWSMGYDSLNRLQTATATFGPYQGLALGWQLDSFGNRQSQTASGNPTALPLSALTLYNPNSNNQAGSNNFAPVAGDLTYDAAGNNTYDGSYSYTYDAENRICAVLNISNGATTRYFYDADGNRVAKAAATTSPGCSLGVPASATITATYILGPSGEQMTEFDQSGAWAHTNIFANGELLATYDTVGLHFRLNDPLGTVRVQASGLGVSEETFSSLPYGDGLIPTPQGQNAEDATEQHFTGKERDTESGLDYFGARYYASSMGRFMSPDWSAKEEPVPYSKLDNPQTLNLYAYVGNNPLSRVDPTGHADIAAECKGQATCNKTLVQTVNIVHQDKQGHTITDSTLKVTTNFSLTTDAKGNVSASASSTVANVSGLKFSDSQLATMGKDIGTMQQAAVGMGFGQNTTELVTAVGASESHFGASPSYAGAPGYMNPAINPMQLTGGNGANMNLNHNIEGGMGVLDWAGRPSDFDPTSTYTRYSDHSPTTMSNWNAIYGSINEQQP